MSSITVNGVVYELPGNDNQAQKVTPYNDALIALANQVDDVSGGVAWTAVAFTNSWVDFGGAAQAVQYRKIGDIVYLRGCGKTGTINLSAFTLPSGYRPPAALVFAVISNDALGKLQINADGTVVPVIGSNVFFYFNAQFSVTA